MMAVLHRTLFTWMMSLIFFIMLVLKMDEKVNMTWFIVFIPMWFFDLCIIIYIVIHMITHCRSGHDRNEQSMAMKAKSLISIFLKIAFQILLCVKLDYVPEIPLYYVFIPLWILLVELIVDVFRRLVVNR